MSPYVPIREIGQGDDRGMTGNFRSQDRCRRRQNLKTMIYNWKRGNNTQTLSSTSFPVTEIAIPETPVYSFLAI